MNRQYIWKNILNCNKIAFAPTSYLIVHTLAAVYVIYLSAVVIEFFRVNLLEKPIFKIHIFDKYFEKIDRIINI